jgi:hypothetical protein
MKGRVAVVVYTAHRSAARYEVSFTTGQLLRGLSKVAPHLTFRRISTFASSDCRLVEVHVHGSF